MSIASLVVDILGMVLAVPAVFGSGLYELVHSLGEPAAVYGYAETALNHDLESQGMRFLHKPYAPAELLAALAAVLRPPDAVAA